MTSVVLGTCWTIGLALIGRNGRRPVIRDDGL